MNRWGRLGDGGHYTLVELQATDGDPDLIVMAMPAFDGTPNSFLVPALPMSSEEEPPQLRCRFVLVERKKLKGMLGRRPTMSYTTWMVDEVERTPDHRRLQFLAEKATGVQKETEMEAREDPPPEPSSTQLVGEGMNATSPPVPRSKPRPVIPDNFEERMGLLFASKMEEISVKLRQELTTSVSQELKKLESRVDRKLSGMERDEVPTRRRGVLGVSAAEVDSDDSGGRGIWDELAGRRPGNDPTSGGSLRCAQKNVPVTVPPLRPVEEPTRGHSEVEALGASIAATLAAIADSKASKNDPLTEPFSSGFKMKGAEGRIRQEMLNEEFLANPRAVWGKFEQQVAKVSKKTSFSEVALESYAKTHIPMGEHKTATRYLQGLMTIYELLEAGQVDHARAQTALLIGATQQMVLDDSWDPAWHVTGLGPPGFHEYKKAPKRDPRTSTSEDEVFGSCVDPRRVLTARQIKADHKAALNH